MKPSLRRRIWFLGRQLIFWYRFRYAKRRSDEVWEIGLHVGKKFLLDGNQVDTVHHFLAPKPGYDKKVSSICWEAPVVMLLMQGERPLFGMAVELMPSRIHIRQLQGERGTSLPKELHDWPRRCVEAVLEYARQAPHIESVRLYRAHTDLFYAEPYVSGVGWPDEKTAAAIRQGMRRRYDGTARQLGFTMKKDWGEFDTHS